MKVSGGRCGSLILFLLFATRLCGAADVCPWITQGSVAKLLEGDVQLSIQTTDDKQGSCNFSRVDGKVSYTLEVSVGPEANGTCPKGSAELRGIGNEAYFCSVKRSSSETLEKVSSRVRDSFFTVTLSASGPRGLVMPDDARRSVLDQAAEQVAGNLF
jgi:hypothetical protein